MKFLSSLLVLCGSFSLGQGQGGGNSSSSAITPCNGNNPNCVVEFAHWMRFTFWDDTFPTERPDEVRVDTMLEASDLHWLDVFVEFQNETLGVSPTTISSLSMDLINYDECMWPDEPNATIIIPGDTFWCEVLFQIERTDKLFDPDNSNPAPPPSFKETFEQSVTNTAIQNYIYNVVWENGFYTRELQIGGSPDPNKSGEEESVTGMVSRQQAETNMTASADDTDDSSAASATPLSMIILSSVVLFGWFL